MDLAVHLEHAVRQFPRYHKYTLGSELRQTAQRLCRLVAHALAAQTGHTRTGFKRRELVLVWRPAGGSASFLSSPR